MGNDLEILMENTMKNVIDIDCMALFVLISKNRNLSNINLETSWSYATVTKDKSIKISAPKNSFNAQKLQLTIENLLHLSVIANSIGQNLEKTIEQFAAYLETKLKGVKNGKNKSQ